MRSLPRTGLRALLISALVLPSFAAYGDGRWEFQAGLAARRVGRTQFHGGSDLGAIPPNPFVGAGPVLPAGVGSATAYDDRTYDDGFVFIGSGTAVTGLTSYWGYTDAGQVQGDNLVFTATGGTRSEAAAATTALPGKTDDQPDIGLAPYLELSRFWPREDDATTELGLTVNLTWMDTRSGRAPTALARTDYTLTDYDVTVVDTYGLDGVVPPLPPYSGSFSPPGPLIENIPDNRTLNETAAGTDTVSYTAIASDRVKLDLQTLSLGGVIRRLESERPALSDETRPFSLFEPFSGQIEAGVTLNRFDIDWRQQQTITQTDSGGTSTFSTATRRDSGTGFKVGAYAAVGLNLRLNEADTRFISIKGRYDLAGSETVGTSAAGAEVDLDGWSLIIAYGFAF